MAIENQNSTTPANEKDYAQTPVWFMSALFEAFGFVPDLDVCAQAETAKAEAFYCLADGLDGLALPWSPSNWCNPPFSDITPWIEKAFIEQRTNGATTYMIFPDSPETGYCRASWALADRIYHMPFRMRFIRPDGSDFRDDKGRIVTPKFSTRLVVFDGSRRGASAPVVDYFDPRAYIDGVKIKNGSK